MTLSILILVLVTAERLAEVALARRNTARLKALGGVEHGAGHYPLMVGMHAVWLVVLWVFAWDRPVSGAWLGVFALLQVMRAWVLTTLGGRWTTRIVVVPGEVLVRRGPYRFVRHPNYLVVAGEIAVLPLAFGLCWAALVFSLVNAVVLSIRIRAEAAALATLTKVRPNA